MVELQIARNTFCRQIKYRTQRRLQLFNVLLTWAAVILSKPFVKNSDASERKALLLSSRLTNTEQNGRNQPGQI